MHANPASPSTRAAWSNPSGARLSTSVLCAAANGTASSMPTGVEVRGRGREVEDDPAHRRDHAERRLLEAAQRTLQVLDRLLDCRTR